MASCTYFCRPSNDNGCCAAEISAIEVAPVEHLSKEAATTLLAQVSQPTDTSEWGKAGALLA